jgi:F-type H+-transporting ATPase subunit gamma
MTERLAQTTQRLENLQQLGAVTTVMRAISASRTQQAHHLLIGQALAFLPAEQRYTVPRARRTAVILFCAEQGFAGAFSDRMLAAVAGNTTARDLLLIGTRGTILAHERGITLTWHTAMVPHANLVPALASRIADALYQWLSDQEGCRVDVVVPIWSAGDRVVPERRSLLPFDFRRFAVRMSDQPPLITLPPSVLLARLAEEYVFTELCEAALTAFSAENEARVAAMLAAKGNLETMEADLRALERQIRQEEITAEVVELASGASARTDAR